MYTGARRIPSDVRSANFTWATRSGLTHVTGPSALPGRRHMPNFGTSSSKGDSSVRSDFSRSCSVCSVRSSKPEPA